MRKKLVLLGFLMLLSVGMAYAVNASDDLKEICFGVFKAPANEVRIDEGVIPQYAKLSEDQRAKAVEIALGDPQVQEILEEADNYQIGYVGNIFDMQETERGIALIPREGFALVEIQILKKYDQELGLKIYEITVDLLEEEVTEIKEYPEIRKSIPTFGDSEGYIDLTQNAIEELTSNNQIIIEISEGELLEISEEIELPQDILSEIAFYKTLETQIPELTELKRIDVTERVNFSKEFQKNQTQPS